MNERIQVDETIAERFKNLVLRKEYLKREYISVTEETQDIFEELKLLHPDKDFTGCHYHHETEQIVLRDQSILMLKKEQEKKQ